MHYAQDYISQQEKVMSGAFALGMHLLFLMLLIFGVTWQKKVEPQANIVDLWTNLPSQAKPAAPPPPPPQPEVKPQVQPVEPPKATVKPEVAKPDIALKDKAEKERRALEEKQKEAKKREEEAQAVQKQQAAEAQRLAAREQEEAQRKLAEQAAAARQSQIEKYKKGISDKIRRFIVLPPNVQGNPRVEFTVVLLPSGEVLGIRTKSSSKNTAWDNAVERAIQRAQPMPMPSDPDLLREFRELELGFRPQE